MTPDEFDANLTRNIWYWVKIKIITDIIIAVVFFGLWMLVK